MGYTFDERMTVLGPHVHDGVPLVQAASAAGGAVADRGAVADGLSDPGCGRVASSRASGQGPAHRLPDELLEVIEGMALRRPPPHAAEVHRAAVKIAAEQGWQAPSYTVVREVIAGLDRGLLALAHHDGSV